MMLLTATDSDLWAYATRLAAGDDIAAALRDASLTAAARATLADYAERIRRARELLGAPTEAAAAHEALRDARAAQRKRHAELETIRLEAIAEQRRLGVPVQAAAASLRDAQQRERELRCVMPPHLLARVTTAEEELRQADGRHARAEKALARRAEDLARTESQLRAAEAEPSAHTVAAELREQVGALRSKAPTKALRAAIRDAEQEAAAAREAIASAWAAVDTGLRPSRARGSGGASRAGRLVADLSRVADPGAGHAPGSAPVSS